MAVCRWDSHAQDALHSHGMAAITPVLEEATGTTPLTIIVVGGVNVILTPERCLKAGKLDSLRLFRITLGFCDLADHT